MRDSEVVAAIVAGDPDALAEAYQRYAADVYASCRRVLPAPDAADAVQDTFVIAVTRLAELRSPDRLGPWLHAVARNECLRRPNASTVPRPHENDPVPPGLKDQVLAACTDDTPPGRAYRVAVGYRAAPFTKAGFPAKPARFGIRRHPRLAIALGAAVLAAATGLIPALALSGSHQAKAATFTLGGELPSTTQAPSRGLTTTAPQGQRSPQTSTETATPTPTPTGTSTGTGPTPPTGTTPPTGPATPTKTATPSPTATPASSSPATPGTLQVSSAQLKLVPRTVLLRTAHGSFVLTAAGGPVANFSITVPTALAARVKVSLSSGSLAAGAQVTVTVTVTSKTALTTVITVNPGTINITVRYTLAP